MGHTDLSHTEVNICPKRKLCGIYGTKSRCGINFIEKVFSSIESDFPGKMGEGGGGVK